MIITQTPFRLSFFGGGTDYKPFFDEYGGSVLSTTIDKYCYVVLRRVPPFFDFHSQIRYSKMETVRKTEDIEHPLVRNCMLFTDTHNLGVTYDTDLPARSGLGSSSSFAVGLLQGIYALNGKHAGKEKLAKDAIYVERELCNESGGWQDQIAAAYGGLNRIDFNSDGFEVQPVIISKKTKLDLQESLLFFFTGLPRYSSNIAASQMDTIKDKIRELIEMKHLVDEAEKILISGTNLNEFGKLLDYTWNLKRGLTANISTDYIDNIYAKAKKAGALGGKLIGAGGSGFMVFYAEPDKHYSIKHALNELLYVPIAFENNGSKIIHYTPEEITCEEN